MDSLDIPVECLDIEIIPSQKKVQQHWRCDQCSLFYLTKEKLQNHKNSAHLSPQALDIQCRYCGKGLTSNDSKECVVNKKCETCEYRCNHCSQRFLRYSSLLNHENNYSCKNKKKPVVPSKAPVNGAGPKKTIKTLLPKRRPSDQLESKTTNAVIEVSPRKKQKLQPNVSLNNNTKVPKVSKKKTTNTPVNGSSTKVANSKHTTPQTNSTTLSTPSSSSSQLNNPVNYKPFSCHICGENFAFDQILLEHLKTHGDAANCFKCKYCGDEFDTIYKMQFHLATCDLADNEIETLQSPIPALKTTPKKSVTETLAVRKRGRPKKNSVEVPKATAEQLPERAEEKVVKRRRSRKCIEETPPVQEESEETSEIPKRRKVEKTPKKSKRSKSRSRSKQSTPLPPPAPSPEPTAVVDCGDFSPLEDIDDDFHLEYTEDPLADDKEEGNVANGTEPVTVLDEKKNHPCPWPRCTFKFTREKALLCHMKNHQTGEDLDEHLRCHICDVPFDDLPSLRHHINECKGLREEKDDDFHGHQTKQKRQSSNTTMTAVSFQSAMLYRCDVCERVYSDEKKLSRHNCHGGNPLSSKFPCRLCQAEMKDPESLSIHFAGEHPDNKIFECPTCGQEFDDLKETLDHGYAHLANIFECQLCIEKLPSRLALVLHNNEVHPGVDMTVCVVCNKRYSNAAALSKHRHVHTGERPFHCPYCYATFALKCSQQVHVRRHINYRPFPCSYCPKRFFNSGDMSKHMRVHTQERPYKCEHCGMEFVMRETLVNHWKTHKDRKNLKCPKCPKTFKLKTQLFNHMPVHIGVKPFKCPLCDEACYHLGGIQVHLNSVHVKEGMTQCEICGQTQTLRYKLVQHLMTHRADFFQSKADWRNYLKKVKPTMKVDKKGQEKIRTTEQDIYGIIRKRRKANKLNGALIPITPQEEGLYQEGNVEEIDDAYEEVKPVKQRRRRKKVIYEEDIDEPEEYPEEIKEEEIDDPGYIEGQDQSMTDPLAFKEEVEETEPNIPKKTRQRKKSLNKSNQVKNKSKQKTTRTKKLPVRIRQVRSRVNSQPTPERQQEQASEEEYTEESESEEDDQNGIKEEKPEVYSDDEWMQEERCYEPPCADRERTCGTCSQTFESAELLRMHVIVHI